MALKAHALSWPFYQFTCPTTERLVHVIRLLNHVQPFILL